MKPCESLNKPLADGIPRKLGEINREIKKPVGGITFGAESEFDGPEPLKCSERVEIHEIHKLLTLVRANSV